MPFVDYDEVEAACSTCGALFRSAETLEEHRRSVHSASETAAVVAKKSAPSRYVCEVCKSRFRSVEALARHNRSAHVQ